MFIFSLLCIPIHQQLHMNGLDIGNDMIANCYCDGLLWWLDDINEIVDDMIANCKSMNEWVTLVCLERFDIRDN